MLLTPHFILYMCLLPSLPSLLLCHLTDRILWVLTVTGRWAYPFLKFMSPPSVALFFAVTIFVSLGIYFVGKWLGYLRWRGGLITGSN